MKTLQNVIVYFLVNTSRISVFSDKFQRVEKIEPAGVSGNRFGLVAKTVKNLSRYIFFIGFGVIKYAS